MLNVCYSIVGKFVGTSNAKITTTLHFKCRRRRERRTGGKSAGEGPAANSVPMVMPEVPSDSKEHEYAVVEHLQGTHQRISFLYSNTVASCHSLLMYNNEICRTPL